MRIINGKFRRKSIFPPKNFKVRPTTDAAKESLFNVIENYYDIDDLKVLDLFSGTGSISYEFASRGCEDITCIELNYQHFNFINKTIKELELNNYMKAIKSNAFIYISRIKDQQYDIIFADPPYNLKGLETIPEEIFKNNLLKTDGMLIFEHSAEFNFSNTQHFSFHKKYGSVNFSFFEIK